MQIHKLETTDAFVVVDLAGAARAVGVVRLAPKILRDGAVTLARTATYQYASFGFEVSGASAGINARPEERADAVAAFVAEVGLLGGAGAEGERTTAIALEAGRGVPGGATDELLAARAAPVFVTGRDRLRGRGAAAAAAAALGGWDGRTLTVEALDPVATAFVEAVIEAGGTLRAVGTPAGVLVADDGSLDPAAVSAAGDDATALAALGRLDGDGAALAVPADVAAAGSRAGVVDHHVAEALAASLLVPVGPAPVTARGLAVARRGGCEVLPDFLTLGAGAFASEAGPDDAADDVEARATEAIAAAVAEVAGHPEGAYLGACERAEAFLATWQDELPFGRPLA